MIKSEEISILTDVVLCVSVGITQAKETVCRTKVVPNDNAPTFNTTCSTIAAAGYTSTNLSFDLWDEGCKDTDHLCNLVAPGNRHRMMGSYAAAGGLPGLPSTCTAPNTDLVQLRLNSEHTGSGENARLFIRYCYTGDCQAPAVAATQAPAVGATQPTTATTATTATATATATARSQCPSGFPHTYVMLNAIPVPPSLLPHKGKLGLYI